MKLWMLLTLVFSTYVYSSQPEISESDMNAAKNIIEKMMKAQQEESIQGVAKEIEKRGLAAVNEGVSQQFNAKTLDAFGIEKNTLDAENPFMVRNQLVMFVSSSMPIQTLRNYARDLSKVGGVMVIRGSLGNSEGTLDGYLKMRQWIWSILKVDRYCDKPTCATWKTEVLFDPVLFDMYGIAKVPALIYQPDMGIGSYCDDPSKAVKSSAIAYGDAYLGELIDSLIRQGEDKPILTSLRNKL